MANEVQKLSGEYQRTGKEAFSSILRSAGDYRRSLQKVSFEWARTVMGKITAHFRRWASRE